MRTMGGRYHSLQDSLLPGAVVPANGARDAEIAVDTAFHEKDIKLLKLLGLVETPVVRQERPVEPWFFQYKREAIDAYLENLTGKDRQPRRDYLQVRGTECVQPLAALEHLSEIGKVQFTEAMLEALGQAEQWFVSHETRINDYPHVAFPNPALWLLRRAGWLRTSMGYRPVSASVAPALEDWWQALPIASVSAHNAKLLNLPSTEEDVPESVWETAIPQAHHCDNDTLLGRIYGAAARALPAPEVLRCRTGSSFTSLPPSEITVVEDDRHLQLLGEDNTPSLLVRNAGHRRLLLENWQLKPPGSAVTTRPQYVPVGPEVMLSDEFPALEWIRHEEIRTHKLVRCASLILETAAVRSRRSESVDFHVENDLCLALETLGPGELLAAVDRHLALDLSPEEAEEVIANREKAQQAALVAEIRSCSGDAERIAAAIGGDALRSGMPGALLEAVERLSNGVLDDQTLGNLALAIYGVSVLKEFKQAQEERGLRPPTTWAGSSRAVQYVTELGFPGEYAGSEQARRPAFQLVDGPSELPKLHPYQRSIADGIKALISKASHRRGLLALPTGSGKTRIAVQAIAEAVVERSLAGPVLWVAQTDELCEQAVQSWVEVWRTKGPRHQLLVSRLWASNEAAQFKGGTQVVIATIAKLGGCIGNSGYDWLRDTECLVIDEAHGSTEPSYTRLLDWLGLGRGRGDDKCALVGLTATPFRGTSVEETKRLVARYSQTRLDQDALGEITYSELQDMGALARVDHRLIPGALIDLSDSELEALRRTRLLPPTALNKVGADLDRNLALLESIRSLPDDWPILVFAASVDHARTMAALLASQGVSAGAISAETEPAARRHYINRFKNGDLRVLTNYQVLTQGFDAPSVRALYIARPTYSPNLYQQMIGRGLRGRLNGGKARCLIVNVEDNFVQYGEKLAFTEFDHLWSGTQDEAD